MSTSDMDLLKTIKFSDGFSCWHAKWSLENMIVNGAKKSASVNFETQIRTTNSDGVDQKRNILWSLLIDSNPEPVWLGLKWISQMYAATPILYRMVLFQENGGVIFNHAKLHVFDTEHPISWHCLSTPGEIALVKRENLSLHVFVAIPSLLLLGGGGGTKTKVIDENYVPEDIGIKTFIDSYSRLLNSVLRFDAMEENDEVAVERNVETAEEDDDDDEDDQDPMSDVTLVVVDKANNVKYPFNCHRTILMAQSTFFQRYFRRRRKSTMRMNAEMNTGEQNNSNVIEFDDVDWETMVSVLRHMYTGYLPTVLQNPENAKPDSALKLLYAAAKFDLRLLKEYCVSVLVFRYEDDENRIGQLDVAEKWNIVPLKALCVQQLAVYSLMNGKDAAIETLSKNARDEVLELAKNYVFILNTCNVGAVKVTSD